MDFIISWQVTEAVAGGVLQKGVLRNFAKLAGKHKVAPLLKKRLWHRSATLSKKGLWRRCFPVNFAKFLRTPFLTEHLPWLF